MPAAGDARTPTIDEWLKANVNASYRVDLTNINVAELIARDRRKLDER
jgi:hypothetical protein